MSRRKRDIKRKSREIATKQRLLGDAGKDALHPDYSVEATHLDLKRQAFLPYDQTILDRARMQWQFGDWETLAQLNPQDLERHPDKATLALLVGTAHQQLNDHEGARRFVELSRNWGCEEKLIAQLLVAGVHNTLGCAAALGPNPASALEHFRASVEGQGGDLRLAWQARSSHQLTRIGALPPSTVPLKWPSVIAAVRPNPGAPPTPIPGPNQADATTVQALLEATLAHIDQQGAAQAKQISDQLLNVRKSMVNSLNKAAQNTIKQLEAFTTVRDYLWPDSLTPELHGWPISADIALYLIRLIENGRYDIVIEFGSGSSTQIIATALHRVSSRQGLTSPAPQVAFEHLEDYYRQTVDLLERAQLHEQTQVVLSPLVDAGFKDRRNISYRYYQCDQTLADLAALWSQSVKNILVLVDGPPGSTGKCARYPALPLVMRYFPFAALDVLLDDCNRDDEREIIGMWSDDLKELGRGYESTSQPFEKGACLLRIEAANC